MCRKRNNRTGVGLLRLIARLATNLGASKKLAASGSLEDARDQFKILSRKAVHLAEGRSGYHRFVCPHVPEEDGKWVQKIATASNPYE